MERIWLASYPPGVPADIDVGAFDSVRDLVEKAMREFADRPAFTCMGRSMSFAALDAKSAAFGAFLQSRGLAKGTRVALMMPNVLQYPVCLFGVLRAGGVVVNVNPLYTARELEHQLVDSGAEAIVVLENFAHVVAEVIARTRVKTVVVTSLGELLGARGLLVDFVVRHVKKMVPRWRLHGAIGLGDALARGARASLARVDIAAQDLAFLQYTGGTTGVAKGAMLLNRNIIANVLQARAWLLPFLGDARQVIVTPLPLYHIFSLTANCLIFMSLGGENLLIPNPRDIPGMVTELAKRRFTAITGVNTLFNALTHDAAFARCDFSALRVSLGGGMAVQQAVAERWKQVTGCTLVEAYGLTETSPAVTINPLDIPAYNGSIGLPVPSTDIALRDESGSEVPVGGAGELCVRGPQVTAGYWNRPDETARSIDRDGFFATGDVATIDARGFVRIVDRKKDMILVSGFNVYPNEIEAVVAECPGVLESAAIGIPDARCGEAVMLFVVRKDPSLTAEQVVAWCRERLTGYKVPHHIEFRSALPKSNVGKILRRELRDEAKRQSQRQAA